MDRLPFECHSVKDYMAPNICALDKSFPYKPGKFYSFRSHFENRSVEKEFEFCLLPNRRFQISENEVLLRIEMKLFLVYLCLLLVSLGEHPIGQIENWPDAKTSSESFQSSLASAQPSPRPLIKVLYSNGHVIAEGFDLPRIFYDTFRYSGSKRNYLHFGVNKTFMVFDKYVINQEDGVAMEVFPVDPTDLPNSALCREKSSENLRNLIEDCWANIALRELTASEKKQLQKLKNEKKGKLRSQIEILCCHNGPISSSDSLMEKMK